jgi:hypothetical protein
MEQFHLPTIISPKFIHNETCSFQPLLQPLRYARAIRWATEWQPTYTECSLSKMLASFTDSRSQID